MIFDRIAKSLGFGRQATQIQQSRQRASDRAHKLLNQAVETNMRTASVLEELVREMQARGEGPDGTAR